MDPLYSTRSYTQYSVIIHKRTEKTHKHIYTYITESLCCTSETDAHCKSTTCVTSKSLQLSQTVSDPMDCSPPGSFIHGIFQARILEWVAIS